MSDSIDESSLLLVKALMRTHNIVNEITDELHVDMEESKCPAFSRYSNMNNEDLQDLVQWVANYVIQDSPDEGLSDVMVCITPTATKGLKSYFAAESNAKYSLLNDSWTEAADRIKKISLFLMMNENSDFDSVQTYLGLPDDGQDDYETNMRFAVHDKGFRESNDLSRFDIVAYADNALVEQGVLAPQKEVSVPRKGDHSNPLDRMFVDFSV